MKYRDFVRLLEDNGFELKRQRATSHRTYEGFVGGRRRIVQVSFHRRNDDIRPGTLKSMIAQSGLPKSLFR